MNTAEFVDREFERAKTMAYGPNNASDAAREGDFGTWGDWRSLVLRVADAAVAAERERCVEVLEEAQMTADLCQAAADSETGGSYYDNVTLKVVSLCLGECIGKIAGPNVAMSGAPRCATEAK